MRTITACLCLLLLSWSDLSAADAEIQTRPVQGVIRFTNQNPEVLEILGPPGNLGVSFVAVLADSRAPYAGLRSTGSRPATNTLSNAYSLALQAGADAATAIAYDINVVLYTDSDRAGYYTRPVATPPLVRGAEPVTVDIAECAAVLDLKFVDADGQPVAVADVTGTFSSPSGGGGAITATPAGVTSRRIVVPAGPDLSVALTVRRGTDTYLDELTDAVRFTTNAPCDTVTEVRIVLPSGSGLGRITGLVEMEGEFLLSTGPSSLTPLRGRTAIIATGPGGNRRFALVPGDNRQMPASGNFELPNLAPSTDGDPATLWRVQAEMHFRTNRAFTYFVSPALGEGSNPGVQVAAGANVNRDFVFFPGYIRGAIHLAGPPDTDAAKSALRGVFRPSDLGLNEFGIPASIGSSGIHSSFISARGVDRPFPGPSTRTAAGGAVSASFQGEFAPGTGAFEGDYELVVGSFDRTGSVWRRDRFTLTLQTTPTNGIPFVSERVEVAEDSAPELPVGFHERVQSDLRLGFGEVCVRFRSADNPFYQARITTTGGGLNGPDFEGRPRNYQVNIDGAYGQAINRQDATRSDVVTVYLPEGEYDLRPFVNSIAPDGSESTTQLEPIHVRVTARSRTCIEACLRVAVQAPACTTGDAVPVTASIRTCGQGVTRITYQVDSADPVTLCTACGASTTITFNAAIPPGSRTVTVTAEDALGAVATGTADLAVDSNPPVFDPPANLSVIADEPCGSRVTLSARAVDACSGSAAITFEPASGSLFPIGTTTVTATATDASGNTARTTFTVTVRDQLPDPAALLAYESFDYPAGQGLVGQNGGSGFSGPWEVGGDGVNPDNAGAFAITAVAPLVGTLNRAGGAVHAAHNTAPASTSGLVRTLATPVGGDGTTAYLSVVISGAPNPPTDQSEDFRFFGLTLNGSSGADLFIGKPSQEWIDNRFYGIQRRDFFGNTGIPQTATTTTALLVVRCDFRTGRDRFVLYVNPPPGGPEPESGTELNPSFDLGLLTKIGLRSQGEFTADEIRLGRTYADVVPERIAFPTPTLDSATPASIAIAGGTRVTIRGSNFTTSDEVVVDGVPLESPVFVGATELTGFAPALPAGPHAVQIRRCGTVVAQLPGGITGGSLPRIFFLSPRAVFPVGGSRVTVVGTNFTADTRIRVAFSTGSPDAGLLLNTTVNEEGTLITGEAPALPPEEPLGPRDVVADSPAGRDFIPAGITYVPQTTESDPQVVALGQLRTDSATPVDVVMRNGFPNAVSASVQVPGDGPEQRAMSFMRRYRDVFRLAAPDLELTATAPAPEPGELVAVKLGQNFRGIPVIGAELSVLVAGDRVLDAIGGLLPTGTLLAPGFSVVPVVTAAEAIGIARGEAGMEFAVPEQDPALAIFDRSLVQEAASDPHLVWQVSLEGAAAELLIDARSGQVLFRNPTSRDGADELAGLNLNLRDARNLFSPTTPTNQPACYGSSQVLAAGDTTAVGAGYTADVNVTTAWALARRAYAFYNRNFGWRSYDNQSSEMKVVVHSTVGNAQWRSACRTISFRDGWMDFEVMVHEMTHGVVSSTSGLRYFLQSGALDESYADVMGMFADRQAGDLNWTVGEDRVGTAGFVRDIPNAGIRFMGQFNPGDGTETPANDYGNVHANSGIPNFAAYLLATRTRILAGRSVPPVAEPKILRLKFDALRSLTRDSTFLDARTREVSLAREWAARGTYGFTMDDATQVALSWDDVGVGFPIDTDGDGVPNAYDNCPYRPNPRQEDADRDGVGDVCDNCRSTYNPRQEDLDLDGVGDVCDPDRDGDGCLNGRDQHPDSAQIVVGHYRGVLCPGSGGDITRFEGEDTDHDGLRDCEDDDDDGDGIPDTLDTCPGGVFGALGDCTEIRDCPGVARDWFRACQNGGCNALELRATDRINPNPTRSFTFDRVRIVNQSLYVAPNVGTRLSDSVIIFVGGRAGPNGGVQPRALSQMRLELWTQATETEPARLVSVVADYDPSDLQLDQLDLGTFLVFTPPSGTNAPTLGATWHIGGSPSTAASDLDHDGIPDGWEILHGLDPRNPGDAAFDADGDGLTALQEYLAGSDPRSGSSRFAINRIERQAGGVKVQVSAPAGRRVQVERTASLTAPAWLPAGPIVRMNGDTLAITVEDAGPEAQGFYRLREVAE